MRVLVFARDHMGDAINTTGLLVGARTLFPDAEITVEVGPLAAEILKHQPTVDRVIVRPKHEGAIGKLKSILTLRKERFDIALAFDEANMHVLKSKFAGIPIRYGIWKGKKYESWFTDKVLHDTTVHELRDNGQNLLAQLGVKGDFRAPQVFVPDDLSALAEPYIALNNAILHFGASVSSRTLDDAQIMNWVSHIRDRGLSELAVGSDAELEFARQLGIKALTRQIHPLAIFSLISNSQYFVGTDSGPAQMAGATGIAGVVLYRNSRPEYTKPYGDSLEIQTA